MRAAWIALLCSAVCAGQAPADPRARFEQAKQLVQRGDYASAAAEFSDLLKAAPDSPLLYNLLGFCYLKQNSLDRAKENFQHAIALKPDFKAAHNNLGGVYVLQGRVDKAVDEFAAVLKIDPRDAAVRTVVSDLAL